ncbi:hypothetical protein HZ996_11790 [Cryomorphaceae bacterium]|nr:hypothetical protein HZ996_11790 [Cryomorphaceae bacterium]
MDILKVALEWAKDEIFSSTFFMIFGGLFILGSVGFWQIGRTDLAKAYVIPTLVAGLLLMIIGVGLFFTNKSRAANFPIAYEESRTAFVQSELDRAEKTIKEFQNVVFKAIPLIIVASALLVFFIESSRWRAIGIVTIALMVVILLIDTNSSQRMVEYHKELKAWEAQDD